METAFEQPIGTRIRQGDILTGLTLCEVKGIRGMVEGKEDFDVVSVHRQLAVVVTQDCDLDWDFKARRPKPEAGADKLLYEVLLCGVYDEDAVRDGSYRSGAVKVTSKQWGFLRENRDPRYQYLGCLPFGLPQQTIVIADFKDFFSVPCEYLYKMLSAEQGAVERVASLQLVYREHLLQRFGWFLTRIGLQKDFHELVVGAGTTTTPPSTKDSSAGGECAGS